MARPSIYRKPHRTNVVLEKSLYAEATKKAVAEGFGSFSEYVTRLLIADMANKTSAGHRNGRVFQGGHERGYATNRRNHRPCQRTSRGKPNHAPTTLCSKACTTREDARRFYPHRIPAPPASKAQPGAAVKFAAIFSTPRGLETVTFESLDKTTAPSDALLYHKKHYHILRIIPLL